VDVFAEADVVALTGNTGLLLIGLPQNQRLAALAGSGGADASFAMRRSLFAWRGALQDPILADRLRRLVSRANLHLPTGASDIDTLLDTAERAIAQKSLLAVYLPRVPLGSAVAQRASPMAPVSGVPFGNMSATQRIVALLNRTPTYLSQDLAASFKRMVTVEALAGIAAAFAVLLAAQFVGVGEIADAALAYWAYTQAGLSGVYGLYEALCAVVAAVRAPDETSFDQAVRRFAEGLSVVGLALLTAVVTRAARRRSGGGGAEAQSSAADPEIRPVAKRQPLRPSSRTAAESASEAEATQITQPLYRGDGRSPDAIFKEGFQPRGTSTDLQSYVDTNSASAFVGTSKSQAEAAGFASANEGYVYQIDPSNLSGVDVNSAYPGNIYAHEQEVAFSGGIPKEAIISAQKALPGGGLGPIIPNPYYKGP